MSDHEGHEPPDHPESWPPAGLEDEGAAAEPTPRDADEGLLETVVGVFTSPVSTLRRVTRQANVWWAVILLAAIGLLSGIVGYAQRDVQQAWLRDVDGPAFGEAWATASAVLSPITTPLIGALIALILHGMARLFKGQGSYRGMFVGAAFAYVPNVLGVPAALLGVALGVVGVLLTALIGFGLSIWVLILTVIAVRENYALTTGKAIGVVLIPIAVLFAVAILLAVVFFVLVFTQLS